MHVDVNLSSGRKVRVYAPPLARIMTLTNKKHPRPEPPVVTEVAGATGEEISMVFDDDPAFIKSLRDWNTIIGEETNEMMILFALKDEQPPDEWSAEEYRDEMEYLNPDWQPRQGHAGRKLDWFDLELLSAVSDQVIVAEAIKELSSVDQEDVEAVKASFRH